MADVATDLVAHSTESQSLRARCTNEAIVYLSVSDKFAATCRDVADAAAPSALGISGIAAGEAIGHSCGEAGAGASLGGALAMGAAAGLKANGDAFEKLQAAAQGSCKFFGVAEASDVAGKGFENVANLVSNHEAAGVAASIAGRAVGAVISNTSAENIAAAQEAAVESMAVESMKFGLHAALGAHALVPRQILNDSKRKGIEFAGGHSLSFGTREKIGKNGEGAIIQHGSQFRIGGGIVGGMAGAALVGPVGIVVGNSLGSLVGVGGNLGETTSKLTESCLAECSKAFEETLQTVKGFCGGIDVVGVDWLNLDTGRVRTHVTRRDSAGNYTLEQFRRVTVMGLEIPRTRRSELDWRELLRKGNIVEVFTKEGGKPRWARAEVISTRIQNLSVKFPPTEPSDGAIYTILLRSSTKLRCVEVNSEEKHKCRSALENFKQCDSIFRSRTLSTAHQTCPPETLAHDAAAVVDIPDGSEPGQVLADSACADSSQETAREHLDGQLICDSTIHVDVGAEDFSEVCLTPLGSWDFPMSRLEKYTHMVALLEAALEGHCQAAAERKVAQRALRYSLEDHSSLASCCSYPRVSADFPMSHSEKIHRLIHLFRAQVAEAQYLEDV